jgi:hypothetical protein
VTGWRRARTRRICRRRDHDRGIRPYAYSFVERQGMVLICRTF